MSIPFSSVCYFRISGRVIGDIWGIRGITLIWWIIGQIIHEISIYCTVDILKLWYLDYYNNLNYYFSHINHSGYHCGTVMVIRLLQQANPGKPQHMNIIIRESIVARGL